jgi:hypothetical protein
MVVKKTLLYFNTWIGLKPKTWDISQKVDLRAVLLELSKHLEN